MALCHYAVKLTKTPGAMSSSDIETLRSQDFSDEQITVATQVIGYFNYITRIADGLGVDLEPWMDLNEKEWRRRKAQ